MFYIGIYIDDILTVKAERKLAEVKTTLSRKFDIKDLGKLNYFLGMKLNKEKTIQFGLVSQRT